MLFPLVLRRYSWMSWIILSFFFFQAEDGIRDRDVTGVQTCALPISADVDAPDKILYGLTFRQLAILAVAAVIFYTAWRGLHRLVPVPVLLGAGLILGALAAGLVVGRRDGLSLDRWLMHAVRHGRQPRTLSTADT